VRARPSGCSTFEAIWVYLRYGPVTRSPSLKMASSIGFRMESFLSTLLFKLRGLDSYTGGTLTHWLCQPSLDAYISLPISFCQLPDQFIDVHSDSEEIGLEFKHFVQREQNLNDRAQTLWLRGGVRSVDKIQHLNDELIPLRFPKRSVHQNGSETFGSLRG
ncbi:MAG: hypothetical protein WCF17_06130, partial [Terracidiphilus sp.]